MRLWAYAKINWALDIVGVRGDGYHEIDTLMQSVALCDTLAVEPSHDIVLSLEGEADGLPAGEDNLVVKAASRLALSSGGVRGAAMRLQKNIFVGAGLGGGSSDAAAALVGLNSFWGVGASQEELHCLAERIGADVPFCLGFAGAAARARGFGQALTPLAPPGVTHLVILWPGQGLSTRVVFGEYDKLPAARPSDMEAAVECLAAGDWERLASVSGNALQEAACTLLPAIPHAMDDLAREGAVFVRMTGAGSAVYGVFGKECRAREAVRSLKRRWPYCVYTTTRV